MQDVRHDHSSAATILDPNIQNFPVSVSLLALRLTGGPSVAIRTRLQSATEVVAEVSDFVVYRSFAVDNCSARIVEDMVLLLQVAKTICSSVNLVQCLADLDRIQPVAHTVGSEEDARETWVTMGQEHLCTCAAQRDASSRVVWSVAWRDG